MSIEYRGTATARTCDLALELLARQPGDPLPPYTGAGRYGMRSYIIKETPDINTEEVANELWWYHKTIKEAVKDF